MHSQTHFPTKEGQLLELLSFMNNGLLQMMPCSEQVDCISRKVEVRWKTFFGIKSFMQSSEVHLQLMLNGMLADISLAPK